MSRTNLQWDGQRKQKKKTSKIEKRVEDDEKLEQWRWNTGKEWKSSESD